MLPGPAGTAASRKLVRSVFYKGMAAAVTESLRAGQAAGCEEWLRDSIAGEIGQAMLDRLEQGSLAHAVRRADEMAAAAELLKELGCRTGSPRPAATGSSSWLRGTELRAPALGFHRNKPAESRKIR